MPAMIVELYYDYASPWSFLANEILASALPGRTIRYRPTYLRGLEMFAQGVPYSGAKLAYLVTDLRRCAEHHQVAMSPPARFPINGVYALRAALLAQDAGAFDDVHFPLFRAAWREGKDVSDKQVVKTLLAELGHAAIAERLEDPALKERLRKDTEEASKRGVFGAPTFFVGDEMFWGHDRLEYVARASA